MKSARKSLVVSSIGLFWMASRAAMAVTPAVMVPMQFLGPQSAGVDTDPTHYTWWLDVEDANTWQSGSTAAQGRNRATLEGMTAYLIARGAPVGLYAVPTQWRQITGTVPAESNLYRLNSWLPGASTLSGASANCRKAPLTSGGTVTLAQYVSGGLDRNLSCG